MANWRVALPIIGAAVMAALPLWRYADRQRAESAAQSLVRQVQTAQDAFRNGGGRGAYATRLESLVEPCPGTSTALVSADRLQDVMSDYEAHLRAARGVELTGTDCHGRPVASSYYLALQPRAAETPAQQAFAVVTGGPLFVFFDGIAPQEADMAAGGLATRADALQTFKIP